MAARARPRHFWRGRRVPPDRRRKGKAKAIARTVSLPLTAADAARAAEWRIALPTRNVFAGGGAIKESKIWDAVEHEAAVGVADLRYVGKKSRSRGFLFFRSDDPIGCNGRERTRWKWSFKFISSARTASIVFECGHCQKWCGRHGRAAGASRASEQFLRQSADGAAPLGAQQSAAGQGPIGRAGPECALRVRNQA